MDLDFRTKRLEAEQKKAKEMAKLKLQKEKDQALKQKEREKEMEEIRMRQEELKEKLRIEKELLDLHEQSLTNGIHFQKQFSNFYVIPPQELELGDKIILPEDSLVELTNLDVFQKHQAVNFQLEISYKKKTENIIRKLITYCGINEFTAPKETIGLPPKIIDTIQYHSSLSNEEREKNYFDPFIPPNLPTQSNAIPAPALIPPVSMMINPSEKEIENTDLQLISVSLRYIVLSKCKYLKFKPKFHKFYDIEAIKRCLEENLSYHTSITVNDLLVIKYRGENYPLVVTDMKPELYAGSLLNTDVEVEFDYSEEYQEVVKQKEIETIGPGYKLGGSGMGMDRKLGDDSENRSKASSPAIPTSNRNSITSLTGDENKMDVVPSSTPQEEEILSLFSAHPLPVEPPSSSSSSSLVGKFKLPNGKSVMRRFSYENSLLNIFQFVVEELKKNNLLVSTTSAEILRIQLSITAPTVQTFSMQEKETLMKSLTELGFQSMKNQLFFVQIN
jgi:hypothetical protein